MCRNICGNYVWDREGREMKTIEYSVPMRTAIYYTPIGLMTSRNVFTMQNEYLLQEASQFISNVYLVHKNMFEGKKAVVHCGNLGRHGTIMNEHLKQEGYKTILHESGRLKQTIDTFLATDTQFLLVVSAEYGFDFKDISLQFVLKVPFAAMNERLRALERSIGKLKFNEWYSTDALNRLTQQCGRVGRGANSFGCTFILDSKFKEMYNKYKNVLPGWFVERLKMI